MKKILIDQENNAERFWDEIQDRAGRGEKFAVLLSGLDLTSPLYLEDDEAEALWAYAQQIRGWKAGRPNDPILLQDLEGYPALSVDLRPGAEWPDGCLGTYQPHGDGRERILLEAGPKVASLLDQDNRVVEYWDVTIFDEDVPGGLPVDCQNGTVAFVLHTSR